MSSIDKEIYLNKMFKQALTYLTINCNFIPDLGLFHGRMGCVLFFAHYGKISQNKQYEDFAGCLLDEIYEEIHLDLPIHLEGGLCGIGWGIEYLVQHGFMEGDTDEILADIDSRVMEYDPMRISNLSFRRGLAGIAFYVLARLNSPRQKKNLPFDTIYLTTLKTALLQTDFSEKAESPAYLVDSFVKALDGITDNHSNMDISICLKNSDIQQVSQNFEYMPMGLDNGLAGMLFRLLLSKPQMSDQKDHWKAKEKNVYIFEEECKAQNYGIGTYVNQLIAILSGVDWNVYIIHLKSTKTKSVEIQNNKNITHIYLSDRHRLGYLKDLDIIAKQYYQSSLVVLSPYLRDYSVFHLNYMQMEPLAIMLKLNYPNTKTLLTVHYTDWSFALLGNRIKLQEVLNSPKMDNISDSIYKGIENGKKQLQCFDQIVAIAEHSYDDLLNLYKVPEEKLIIIPHGLEDQYIPLTKKERNEKKLKYGFKSNDIILMFAGRIDPVKGINILIESFTLLLRKDQRLNLVIAGDGNYKEIFEKSTPIWSNLTFTGFVNKQILYELYSISDIGILPSLHEEFGFVALEMMMMNLPLIVGNTTGLSELIVNKKSGELVSWDEEKDNAVILAETIFYLIKNRKIRNEYAKQGRLYYLSKFEFGVFQRKMSDMYQSLIYVK